MYQVSRLEGVTPYWVLQYPLQALQSLAEGSLFSIPDYPHKHHGRHSSSSRMYQIRSSSNSHCVSSLYLFSSERFGDSTLQYRSVIGMIIGRWHSSQFPLVDNKLRVDDRIHLATNHQGFIFFVKTLTSVSLLIPLSLCGSKYESKNNASFCAAFLNVTTRCSHES